DASASIHWSAATIDVTSTAHVKNTTSRGVQAITFNLAAQRLGTVTLGDVTVDGAPATADTSDQSVIVQLPSTLAAGGTTDVTIGYQAQFNTNPSGRRYLFMKY